MGVRIVQQIVRFHKILHCFFEGSSVLSPGEDASLESKAGKKMNLSDVSDDETAFSSKLKITITPEDGSKVTLKQRFSTAKKVKVFNYKSKRHFLAIRSLEKLSVRVLPAAGKKFISFFFPILQIGG